MQPAGTDSVHLKVYIISRGPFQSLGFFDFGGGSPACLNFNVVLCPLGCLALHNS